jgi:hypothetical protein
MSEIVRSMSENWIVWVVLICVGSGVITSIAKQIRKYGCHRSETELKRELVERGLSVEEIERVIAATSASEKKSEDD